MENAIDFNGRPLPPSDDFLAAGCWILDPAEFPLDALATFCSDIFVLMEIRRGKKEGNV